jgi:hypothetical protein
MQQRFISETEVEYCLRNHDISYPDKKGNPNYITDTPNGRRIKVVVQKEDETVVITVGD